jgi:hypothetical protein
VHFVTMAHRLAWMEHPVIWLCVSCAILWLVLRVVRSPLVRTGVLLMLCGLGMNALVTDTNAGSMPVIGMPSTVRPASPMWQGATFQTRMPLLADQARLGMFSIGDIALLGGGILIVAICLQRTTKKIAAAQRRCWAKARANSLPKLYSPSAVRPVAQRQECVVNLALVSLARSRIVIAD